MNPLRSIQIGSKDEILQARKLAREITEPMKYRSTWSAIVVQCISVASLYLIYKYHACEFPHYPTIEDVRNFLMVQFVKEEVDDRTRIYPETFRDYIREIIEEQEIPKEGLQIPEKDKDGNVSFHTLNSYDMQKIYPADMDVFNIDPNKHPWLWRNFIMLASGMDTNTASSLAVSALEYYIDEHPDCRLLYCEEIKTFEFTMDEYDL